MSVPLSLFALGLVVAAVLGFVAGWILGSRPATARADKREASTGPAAKAANAAVDPVLAAWDDVEPNRVIMYLRLDAVETWRRTHGQRTIEYFVQEIVAIVTDMLPPGGHVVRKDVEAIAIATGDRLLAAKIAEALKRHRFTHLSGAEALVSAGMGVVEETEDSPEVHVRRALAAVSEATRRVRGGFGIWQPDGVRHVRPVELLT